MRLYLKRLAVFPLASALVSVIEMGRFLRQFDAEMRRSYEEARSRGAPPLDRLPSHRRVVVVAAALGALRGLGFALVRPVLPKRPEAAALIYSTLGVSGFAAGVHGVQRAFSQSGSDLATPPPVARLVWAKLPKILWRAAVTAAIERRAAHARRKN